MELPVETPEQDDRSYLREELLCRVGAQLQAAREQRHVELEEAAHTLKLRMVYLRALESGDWSEMPDEVYSVAFLRQYAHYLDVDVSDALAKLKTDEYKLTRPLTFPDPPIAPAKSWAAMAALAFIVLFVAFNLFESDQEPPAVPEAPVTEPPVPAPQPPQSMEESAEPSAEAAGKNTDQAVAETPALPVHRYRLATVGGDSWVQIFVPGAAGEQPWLLKEALLKDGEHLAIEDNAPYLLLTCGNAAALEIRIDDTLFAAAGSLGDSGQVVREIELRP